MAYLLMNKEYFIKVVEILKKRQIFKKEVWNICALYQDNLWLVKELFAMQPKDNRNYRGIVHLKSSLLTLDENTT
jgi:hypothetical protein